MEMLEKESELDQTGRVRSQHGQVDRSDVVRSADGRGLDQGVSVSGSQKNKGQLVSQRASPGGKRYVWLSACSPSLCREGTRAQASDDREKSAGRAEAPAGSR